MNTSENKHGLSRDIPADIARQVRQRCGFGCVVCGCAIYTYHHADPPFSDARSHDPSGIALLCGKCHDKVTRGILSNDTVLSHLRKPKALEEGFSQDAFDISSVLPVVKFCGTIYRNVNTIVAMMGREILSVRAPEVPGSPMRISGLFCDSAGSEVLRIVNNVWFSVSTSWDVEVVGARITVRRAPRDIALVVRAEPPTTIVIERISMYYQGARVEGQEGSPVDATAPNGARLSMVLREFSGRGSVVGLAILPDSVLLGYGGPLEALMSVFGSG